MYVSVRTAVSTFTSSSHTVGIFSDTGILTCTGRVTVYSHGTELQYTVMEQSYSTQSWNRVTVYSHGTHVPLKTHSLTHLFTYLLTYNLPAYLLTYLPAYQLTYLFSYLLTYLLSYLLTNLPT